MNKKCFIIVCISLISLFLTINTYAFDALTKVQMRNSYTIFEKCMREAQNDITKCLKEFNRAVAVYKKAVKEEPQNENVKQKLLTLVNALYDIAETYYSAAESKKGVNPGVSGKYFTKAAICYDQLIKLYPDKIEFQNLSKQATYLAGYEEVDGYVLELKHSEVLYDALVTCQQLKSTHNSFTSRFGHNEDLAQLIDDVTDSVMGQFANNVKQQFKTELEDQGTGSVQTLVDLVNAQANIISVDPKEKYKTTFAQMESQIIQLLKDLIKSYYADFKKGNSYYNKGDFVRAEASLDSLSTRLEFFPSYSSANSSLQSRIRKATNNFNVRAFRAEVQIKGQVAKNTVEFLSIIEKGKTAFNKKDWIASLKTFRKRAALGTSISK